ncbi:uncharacterized protein TNCV_3658011 [Trichonephila clavipes]|nr:uncharacterized protein TNCV_3658011 [Trichonephila clavipes]
MIHLKRQLGATQLTRFCAHDPIAYAAVNGGGQLDEWKWDCRRLMLLDVSMCLVVLFSDFGINTNPKILCQKTCSRPTTSYNTCRRPFSSSFGTKGEEPLLCRSWLQTTFKHQEEESPLLRCEIIFTMQVCMQEDQLCAFPSTDDSEGTACWAREHVSWTQQQWASVLFTDESRFTMESDSGRLLIWREQRTRYHQSTLLKDTVIEVVESGLGNLARWPH